MFKEIYEQNQARGWNIFHIEVKKNVFTLTMNYRRKTGTSLENIQHIHKKNSHEEKKIGDSRRITGLLVKL